MIAAALLPMFSGTFGYCTNQYQTHVGLLSIAHMGYALLGDRRSIRLQVSAAMFYTTYVLVAGAFAIIALLSKQGIELDQLEDYRGLNARNPGSHL